MKKIISFVLILLIGMTLSACQKDDVLPKDDVITCSEGQEVVDGVCKDIFIPATSCDEGDILVQGYCVPDPNPRKPEGEVPKDDVQACKGLGFEYDESLLVYDMVWNDEFDGTELDSTKWRYEVNGLGGGNGELQYYTDENVVVSDGTLKIIARKEEYNGKEYTSSRITTQFTQDWKYGKFQIRAKIPGGRGTWPAIWMIPMYNAYGGWPDSGEIDIMESVGYDPYKVHSTLHTEIFNDANFNSQKGSSKTLSDPMNNFHVYELEWLPETIRFYVDGELIFTYVPRDYKVCPTSQQWPFDKQFFMILNVAIGGSWGGINGVDNTIFPVEMEVDYVRVFQSETITDIKPIE